MSFEGLFKPTPFYDSMILHLHSVINAAVLLRFVNFFIKGVVSETKVHI